MPPYGSSRASFAQVDLGDPRFFTKADFHDVFRQLRDHAPLHWNPDGTEPGFWSVTRHADCLVVQRDARTFSSAATNVLGPHRWDSDEGSGRMLNATDAPRHTELRKLVSRFFTPRALARLEPYLRDVISGALEPAVSAEECDFVEVVQMLPVASIATVLGVPRDDWDLLLRLTSSAFGSADRDYRGASTPRATARQSHAHLLAYCRRLIRERLRQPRDDDIVTLLAVAERDGRLTAEEAMLFFDLLMLGGNETTRHGAVGALVALIEFPGQWRTLRENRQLLDSAVDETLRWTSPSRHVLRRANRRFTMHGRVVEPGQDVVIWHVSANRDERVFRDPDRFDVERTPNPHLAFGSGPHFCLGATLAKLELRVFLDELMSRVSRAELLAPPSLLSSSVIGGVKHLRVRLRGT